HVNPEIFKDYVHQRTVAEKALRDMGGAALLADETGLGKTMEAGIIAAELIVRGLVRTVLVIVPASLSHQWREEMHEKFALELKSLIDVLKPGLLGSTRAFNKQYVDPKDPRRPRNVHHLRTLLAEVLIRNRRHEVSVKLPPRRAVTYHLELGPDERAFYDDLSEFIRNEVRDRVVEAAATRHSGRRYSYVLALVNLQRELTSSAPAVEK